MTELWTPNPRRSSAATLGGKGRQLVQLREAGYRVPPFSIFTTAFFEEFERTNGQLSESALKAARAWMQAQGGRFAVRSSSNLEDGQLQSYAGLFETILNVEPQQLETSLKTVLASAHAAREKGYSAKTQKMAVVLQKMITPEFAGVAFSRNPTEPSALIRIEACRGLGTGVVDGTAETETLLKLRFTPALTRKGPTLLPPEAVERIEGVLLQIESEAGHPVDIEWAWADQQLFLLQSRPITQNFEPLKMLSDANLSESYPGFTAPLTCDFVSRMYEAVFTDSARLLGASAEQLQELSPHYAQLVQDLDGHLYYNLESYAVAMGALPGGARAFKAWLQLIGFADALQVPVPRLKSSNLWAKTRTLLRLIRLSRRQDQETQQFLKRSQARLSQLHQEFQELKRSQTSAQKIFDRLVLELSAPHDLAMGIFNDYFLMSKKGPQNVAASTNLHLESVRPQQELAHLARHFADPSRRELLEQLLRDDRLSEDTLFEIFTTHFGEQVAQDTSAFLVQYGERSFGDLKLENLTLRQDPRSFLLLLLRAKPSTQKPASPQEPQGLSQFERALIYREHCRLLRTRYFGWFRDLYLLLGASLFPGSRTDIFYLRFDDLNHWRAGVWSREELWAQARKNRLASADLMDREHPALALVPRSSRSLPPQGVASESGKPLQGELVSAGRISGLVFKVKNPNDIPTGIDLRTCVLVTETTDPAWVYLLSECQALISERGSALSHVAIIARELKKPLLVKVPGARALLEDGEWIEVDDDGLIVRGAKKT